ncbi:MAG: hypothetical protein LBO64_00835 [Desulfovibrio sp.]|jgi:hypothetical protein|nr:hypothetical protein [Desulfovibrio sp.]
MRRDGPLLRKGVLLPAGKLAGLLRESMLGDCALDEDPLEPEDVKKRLVALPPDALVLLSFMTIKSRCRRGAICL